MCFTSSTKDAVFQFVTCLNSKRLSDMPRIFKRARERSLQSGQWEVKTACG